MPPIVGQSLDKTGLTGKTMTALGDNVYTAAEQCPDCAHESHWPPGYHHSTVVTQDSYTAVLYEDMNTGAQLKVFNDMSLAMSPTQLS